MTFGVDAVVLEPLSAMSDYPLPAGANRLPRWLLSVGLTPSPPPPAHV